MAAEPVVAALCEANAYPHRCREIELVETHISWVFLTGDYAYKLKKPLDFGFLDFTTLARREFYCREELRCNAAFAPELYLECVTITRDADGRYRVGGDGEVVEYAVRMRQFDGREQLDHVLERGELDVTLLQRFARDLAGIYARLPPLADGERYGAPHVFEPLAENFRELRRLCAERDARVALDDIEGWTERRHRVLTPILDRRARAGFIRECHGDLHLRNLVRHGTEIRAFDCIEFSESLRFIDPVSDIAFLFMDCAVRGRADLAYAFADAYFDTSGDYEGAALLRYYAVYRSLVRAKIAGLRLQQSADEETASDLRDHLGWARRAAGGTAPILVLTCGVSGSGKSWLASRLVSALPALRVRSDVARRFETGSPDAGASRYSAQRRRSVYDRLRQYADTLLAGGDNVIVDATFLDAAERAAFATMAAAHGSACVVVYCHAARECLEQRVREREAEGADPSEATVAVLRDQLNRFDVPRAPEIIVEVVTDESFTIDDVAGRVMRAAAGH